jgi:NAD(P)-dependent dehydrogenase (short-subunit alcohol dehydrogenase family)
MTATSPLPVAVVTGGTGGLGRHVALGLARAGRQVVLLARNAERGEAARDWILNQAPEAVVELELADLSLLGETRAAGERIAARHPEIALLVANAGVFEARPVETSEGLDRVLAVNLLSPFVLAGTLLPALQAGAPARIVMTGSSSSDRAHLDPEGLVLGRRWGMVRAYAQSKLALLMATFALAERLEGSGVTATVVHPGFVATGLVRTGGVIGLAWSMLGRFGLSEAQGADSPLHAALDPGFGELSGVYVKRRRPVRPNHRALDPAACRRVLAEVERLAAPFLP